MEKLLVNHFWELTGWDFGREGWVLCFSGSYLLHWWSLVVPVSQPVNTPVLLHFLLSLQGWGHHWTHLLLPLHLPLRSSGESWSWYGQTGVRLNINKIIAAPVDPEGVINAPKSVAYVLSIFFYLYRERISPEHPSLQWVRDSFIEVSLLENIEICHKTSSFQSMKDLGRWRKYTRS